MKKDRPLCARCKKRPQRPKHRYCKECHAKYMREHRAREKARRQKMEMTHCPHCGKALLDEGEGDHVVAKEAEDE